MTVPIDVKPTYGASILVANREAAYEWLRDHGYDDIIKNDVSVSFGRGEDDMAGSFKALAEKKDTFLNRIQLFIPKHLELLSARELKRAMNFQWIYLVPM